MGTPEFAVATLDKLIEGGCNIVGVVTAPDKPAGRGLQLSQSAVKKYAVEHGLHIMQPIKLKDPLFFEELKKLHADVQVVVAFRMLPEIVWNMPPLGTINLHGSLLPAYRGAAPINWAIINGETETGVTTFKLKQEIDTGDILMQEVIAINSNETAGELHDKMKLVGASLILNTLELYCKGEIAPSPQLISNNTEFDFPSAPKLTSETCKTNWGSTSKKIYDLIRGLSPYPAAFTYLDGKIVKIFQAEISTDLPDKIPGSIDTDKKTFLRFATLDGWILIKELQLEGKKKMDIASFLRGYHFN
jgi:methionyl-tRNA formyltransferase